MRRLKVGHLDVALLDELDRNWTLLIDWRLSELGRRWRLKVGHLDVALLDAPGRRWTLLIDWRLRELNRRWRLSVGPKLWVPFSERYGYVSKARRWRLLGLDFAWYRRGLE